MVLFAQTRSFSDRAGLSKSVLLRTFLHDILYHVDEGYFAKEPPVGSLSRPLDFQSMRGQQGMYRHIVISSWRPAHTCLCGPFPGCM